MKESLQKRKELEEGEGGRAREDVEKRRTEKRELKEVSEGGKKEGGREGGREDGRRRSGEVEKRGDMGFFVCLIGFAITY